VHLDSIKVYYLPTDAQENCFKKNVKIYFKTAPTYFGLFRTVHHTYTNKDLVIYSATPPN